MLQKTARFFLIACLLNAVGMQRPALQIVAWARMTAAFSRTTSVRAAIQNTFDGKHPCALCLKLRKVNESTRTLRALPSKTCDQEMNLEFTVPSITPSLIRQDNSWMLSFASAIRTDFISTPDAPPPKLAA